MKQLSQSFQLLIGRYNCQLIQKDFLAILLILVMFIVEIQSQYLTVIPVTEPDVPFNVTTEDSEYQFQNLDIIWNISYPAELKISKFDIDAMSGEFVVICQYPLPNDGRLSTGAAAEDIVHLLPVENSLLLSPELIAEKKPPEDEDDELDDDNYIIVRISSQWGGFVYFHAVNKATNFDSLMSDSADKDVVDAVDSLNPKAFNFNGFHIQLSYLELNPTVAPPSTTERLTTPAPGIDIYIKKHVIGKTPGDFYRDLKVFKERVALMGNAYCEFKKTCHLSQYQLINETDVRLTKEMIFFCDRSLSYYETCVQVQFAITIRNMYGAYLMTSDRLEEMWNLFAEQYLAELKLKPEVPPSEESPIVTWIWVAAALGIILAFSSILCFTLVGNNVFHSTNEQDANKALTHERDDDVHSPGSTVNFGDRVNPIIKIIQSMGRQQQDEDNYKMYDLDELDREFTERNKRDLQPINELYAQKGYFNQALNDDDEVQHWPPQSSAIRGSRHNHVLPSRPIHYSIDEESDDADAIEINNHFFGSSK